jgi:hypothetical protein
LRSWTENRRVLAAFSDPAGAKAVLAFLCSKKCYAETITVVSDRHYSFYDDFGHIVHKVGDKSLSEWLQRADVLITGTSYPVRLEVDLIEAARRIGILSISFVDHWTNLALRFESQGQRITPQVICVVDARARDLALSEGLFEEELLIFGNPYHQYLRSWQPHLSRNDFLGQIGLEKCRQYLLYVPEPLSTFGLRSKYGFDEAEGLKLLLKAMEMLGDSEICLVVKGHPNQHHELLETIIKQSGFRNSIYLRDGRTDLFSYYAVAVAGHFSNALIEAELLSKIIIRVLPHGKIEYVDPLQLSSESDVFLAKDSKEIANILRLILA